MKQRTSGGAALNVRPAPVDICPVLPQIAPARQAEPRPSKRDELLERLRGVVGPAGAEIADGLVEALRQELKREYERGYHDGWASVRPVNDTAIASLRRRARRHARRGLRHWWAHSSLLRPALRMALILVLTAGAVMLSLRITSASKDKKFSPPTITW